MNDYARIEKALAFLEASLDDRPDLDAIAAKIGLSPFHFQRLFTRWVGVSPKKFQEYLGLDRAKACLAQAGSVLDAALEAGLSGPGRLHDMFVSHEAVTPGEFKRGGDGLDVAWGWADSPFGPALVMTSPRGICGLAFAVGEGEAAKAEAFADMRRRFPHARLREDAAAVRALAARIFDARAPKGQLKLLLHGSPFQVQVWRALLAIPPGALVAYDDIAAKIGKPTASRAVGSAVGANPISFLVPCHRVIRKSGAISHYHWGRPRKLAMIGWEAAHAEGAMAPPV
ncbi:MAG: methylated-DNA--[protein]-cysteine S-methyltransferase [Azospirillum sp.]|nr:methylated-DNA--[protein]-cysteine S-methyltransferase [Azospirillum sp.]MCA3267555.1 methylated-DNA--[protein]-cysteine S-methyltransferase [Azospirillum sp.]MCZ8122612.1 methylated-DNA--[protein]-cysteine S-methyltransferase [Magnetospirillum sp.]